MTAPLQNEARKSPQGSRSGVRVLRAGSHWWLTAALAAVLFGNSITSFAAMGETAEGHPNILHDVSLRSLKSNGLSVTGRAGERIGFQESNPAERSTQTPANATEPLPDNPLPSEPLPTEPGGDESADAPPRPNHVPESNETRLPIPDWVEQGSYLDGEDQIELVVGEPCPSRILATRDLEKEMVRRTVQVLDQWFGTGAGQILGVDADDIRSELVEPQRLVVVPYDDANTQMLRREMGDPHLVFYRGFAQLRFSADFRQEALRRIEESETRTRLMTLGRAVLIAFATMLAAFAFFRLNHVTRGFYTARLLSLIAVVFLLLLALILGW